MPLSMYGGDNILKIEVNVHDFSESHSKRFYQVYKLLYQYCLK